MIICLIQRERKQRLSTPKGSVLIIEFCYRFEAAHRFLNSESRACMTPHGHSWIATLVLTFTGQKLDEFQMTVEFSKIKKDWKNFIQETFDHSFMHNINDPIIEVLKNSEIETKLVPFPGDPTTEIIALFMFQKMDIILNESPFKNLIQVKAIKLQETITNTVICDRDSFKKQMPFFKECKGWWLSLDTEDRSLDVIPLSD